MQSAIPELLTKKQTARLAKLHTRMRQSAKSIGEDLTEIKNEKLYREYGTFEVYCQKEWGFTPQYAHRLLAFEGVKAELKKETRVSFLPETEGHARALAKLPEGRKAEAWTNAVEAANGKHPTTAQVNEAVEDLEIPESQPEQKDDFGYVIPEKALKAFSTAKDVEKVCREITALVKSVLDMCDQQVIGTRYLRADVTKELAQQLKQSMLGNIAYAVCPYCDGKGCDTCKSAGWVNRSVYEGGKTQRESHAQLAARLKK